MRIVIVGPCASGKTTLVNRLRALGYDAQSCAQEHSYVPQFWRRLKPDVLIFLDLSVEALRRRIGESWWDEVLLAREQERLKDARRHCDLLIATDHLTPEQVLDRVIEFLTRRSGGYLTYPEEVGYNLNTFCPVQDMMHA